MDENSKAGRYLCEKDANYERLEATRLAFLEYVNARYASCVYFEGKIKDKKQAREAMRISLDAWETPDDIERFVALRPPFFKKADYDLAGQWQNYLHGPLYCMEAHGQTALFMCESRVFEVVSFGRSWNDMVPVTPDLVLATLLPFGEIIVSDGLLMHHCSKAVGPGVLRIQQEFEKGKSHGIVRDAHEFVRRTQEINDLHERIGWDPTSYYTWHQYIDEINNKTYDTCFPYEIVAKMRSWDAA